MYSIPRSILLLLAVFRLLDDLRFSRRLLETRLSVHWQHQQDNSHSVHFRNIRRNNSYCSNSGSGYTIYWRAQFVSSTNYSIIIFNFFLFVCVCVSVMSCFRTRLSERNVKHVLALLNIATITDVVGFVFTLTIAFYPSAEIFSGLYYFLVILNCAFYLRLIPHVLFVLFCKMTRDQWRRYFRMRINRAWNWVMKIFKGRQIWQG